MEESMNKIIAMGLKRGVMMLVALVVGFSMAASDYYCVITFEEYDAESMEHPYLTSYYAVALDSMSNRARYSLYPLSRIESGDEVIGEFIKDDAVVATDGFNELIQQVERDRMLMQEKGLKWVNTKGRKRRAVNVKIYASIVEGDMELKNCKVEDYGLNGVVRAYYPVGRFVSRPDLMESEKADEIWYSDFTMYDYKFYYGIKDIFIVDIFPVLAPRLDRVGDVRVEKEDGGK